MKPMLYTASVAALMMAAAACSDAQTSAQTASYDPPASETPAATPGQAPDEYGNSQDTMMPAGTSQDAMTESHATFTLASDEVLASDLIGAEVDNPAGEKIATVADVWIGEEGDTPKLIVRKGGVAGVGGTLHAVSFDDATIQPVAGDDEPDVRVTYSAETLDSLPEFEQAGLDDFRLASEVMGSTASFAFSDDLARVKDFVLADDGQPEYAVITEGAAGVTGYVIDADKLRVEQGDGDGSMVIDMDKEAFSKAKVLKDDQ